MLTILRQNEEFVNMPRPFKCRRISHVPGVTFFKPAGVPMRALEEMQLTMEEAEAIRLKDLEGLDQEPAAEKMNVSRATFQRVLGAARQKVADALLNGKAIRITGGNFELGFSRYRCRRGHEWDIPHEQPQSVADRVCPTCAAPGTETAVPAASGK
jgi:predicted DNA-binding protein (UPF0251 family)